MAAKHQELLPDLPGARHDVPDVLSRVHRAALTGQQFQSPDVEPVYVLFEDFTHVKF